MDLFIALFGLEFKFLLQNEVHFLTDSTYLHLQVSPVEVIKHLLFSYSKKLYLYLI